MKHGRLITFLALVLSPAVIQAQEGWKFRWAKGAKLGYQGKHVRKVAELIDGRQRESTARLSRVKRWTVRDVPAKGVAPAQLSLVAMRNEQIRPGGNTLLFDSQDLEKSTPELREAMAKFIGKPLAV